MKTFSCLFIFFSLLSLPVSSAPNKNDLYEYSQTMRPETAAAREARHLVVAARRAGLIIMVHRGASAFAPENTLEAYAAAMDYGADQRRRRASAIDVAAAKSV